MGKSLIIKGADFSANAVVSHMALKQGGVNVTNTNINNFGRDILDTSNPNYLKRMRSGLIRVPVGSSIVLKGVSGLKIDYCFYNQSFNPDEYGYTTPSQWSVSHPYVKGSASDKVANNYFPFNRNGAESIALANATEYEYFEFIFAATNEGQTVISNFDITFNIV